MILPGSTLGVLGGGQLGRMFTVAARTMGYHVVVLDPDPDSPAGALASEHLCADYRDAGALARMGEICAAVTVEFENVPADSLAYLADHSLVRPGPQALALVQDRLQEKTFLASRGFPTPPFAVVEQASQAEAAFAQVGGAGVLKVSRFGYDGKGQARVADAREVAQAFEAMGRQTCVLERFLDLEAELSVVLARGADGAVAAFPVVENQHRHGILDRSLCPARVEPAVADQALHMAQAIAEALDYCGVMAVEFFLLPQGRLVVNEIAPRPHNSGHFTGDACLSSQFEQQVRALCGLPLAPTELHTPTVMVNLLGDSWSEGEPDWGALLRHNRIKLHLYGKGAARPGRKMGHYNCLGPQLADAIALADRTQQALKGGRWTD
ncbi:5-(carboxyamino)imidazole ribonucleotide synthase [Ectothiorhodospiraceae bacterium 2226]|nr:5-(carboxyamino)imidazole ribonucleotide synthase [Ectothiorhodospiraceae bacterium 2226]